MKSKFIDTALITATLAAMNSMSGSAMAQEINLPQLLLGNSYPTFSQNEESQIVIRVRDFSSKEDLCGTGFNLSRLGISSDGFDFPHPGSSRSGSFDRQRSSNSYDFPRSGGMVSYFQLPVASRSPNIVGCLDNQRNILFINIRPQVRQPPTPPVEVNHPAPTLPPQPEPTPTGQILLPQQPSLNQTPNNQNSTNQTPNKQTFTNQLPNYPIGFPTSYPVIK